MRKTIVLICVLLFVCASALWAQKKEKIGDVELEEGQNYVVLSTKRIQTMEKELDEAAAKGFRILFGAPTQNVDLAILLRRVPKSHDEPYKYRVLATSRLGTMEKEMNEAAQGGYRLLPSTITLKSGLFTTELFVVMERAPNAPKNYEYKLIQAGKEVNMQKKMGEAEGQGFVPVTMITLGKNVIVLEKESAAEPSKPPAKAN